METIAISHGDADGVICATLFLKKFGEERPKIYFSSATRLGDTLCYSITKSERFGNLYIFDISPTEKSVMLASLFNQITWIDHHEIDLKKIPSKINLVVKEEYPSAAMLVGEYLGIDSHLIELANEIDTNQIKSEEALFLRDLISAIRWKYVSFSHLNRRLRSLTKNLAFHGIEKFEKSEKIANLINEYKEYVRKIEDEVLEKTKVFETNGKRIAIYETLRNIPVYIVSDKLKEHEKSPFDIIAVIMYKTDFLKKNVRTKIELRTHTNRNVLEIARVLGGGGHKRACGATVNTIITPKKLMEIVNSLG